MNNSLEKSNTEQINAFFREAGADYQAKSITVVVSGATKEKKDMLLIQDPTSLGWKLINFIKTLQRVVENNSQVAIINTGGRYGQQYADMWEGINIPYYCNPWQAGTLTNPLRIETRPDLIIFISGGKKDYDYIIREIEILEIPMINLSAKMHYGDLISSTTIWHEKCINFSMEFLYILLRKLQKLPNVVGESNALYNPFKNKKLKQLGRLPKNQHDYHRRVSINKKVT